ncbi:MAG: MATE family efflux transporter [Clostridiales bacterium]|nr:MATE family efflux transporter [Clostridiales bacterium]
MPSVKHSSNEQFRKMTETPVGKLVSRLAVPTVISMMISMIYNAADTYFVSEISIPASGATSIVFTLMGIIQACGFTFGHGAGSNISRKLGANDHEAARTYGSTAFFEALFLSSVIAAVGIIWLTPIMKLIGSTDTILPYSKTYGMYIFIAAPALVVSCVMNNILRYEGMAMLATIGLTTGGVLNIILDPILIFKCNLGIAGAGIATAISQYISMLILLYMFLTGKTQCRISLKYFSFKPRVTWDIISTGMPSFARQGLNSASIVTLNICAHPYGDVCIAAMGIVSKCSMLMFSIGVGIGQGFQPVASFNYGAQKYDRVRKSIFFTWKFDTFTVAAFSAVVFIFADKIVSMFRPEIEIITIGTAALRFLCVALIFLPTVIISNMTFQSIGKTGRAFFLACAQNGLFYIPLIIILSRLIGITGIELAQPIAYTVSAIVSAPFLLYFTGQLKKLEEDKSC